MKKNYKKLIIFIVLLFITNLVLFAQLKGKKVLMIIASNNFRDEELFDPKKIFEEKSISVTIASSKLSESKGMIGAKVKPDLLIKNVKVKNYDAIIFVGGSGSYEYFNDKKAHNIAATALKKKKLLCAICIAPNILANAGLLKGKKVTCYDSANLKKRGAIFTGKSVEQDGKIITAKGPGSSKEFAYTIIDALKEKK